MVEVERAYGLSFVLFLVVILVVESLRWRNSLFPPGSDHSATKRRDPHAPRYQKNILPDGAKQTQSLPKEHPLVTLVHDPTHSW